jgi:hypothetical protein
MRAGGRRARGCRGMTLSKDGLILVAEEGGHVVVKRDKRNSRWLLINAIGYAFDGVVIETVALFGYCAPDDFAGDNLVVPDKTWMGSLPRSRTRWSRWMSGRSQSGQRREREEPATRRASS